MKRRTNGEGSIYETIKKNKRKVFLETPCKTCKNCTKKCNRKEFEKCETCKNCTSCIQYCDRYYCYKVIEAQVTINGKRKSAGSGNTKKEVSKIKEQKAKRLNIQENMEFGNFSLIETMKYNEEQKLKYNLVGENAYNRNLDTISAIEKNNISNKNMRDITQDDIKSILSYFVNIQASQSQLEKVYDEIKGACKISNVEFLFKNIERNTFVSNIEKKAVESFSSIEKNSLLNYIDTNTSKLVLESKANVNCATVKNLIHFAFYTGMRIR